MGADLDRRDHTRTLIYWWPRMVEQAEAAGAASAWTVPHQIPAPPKAIRLVTPQLGLRQSAGGERG
jgi:hypothetical protein